MSVLVPFLAAIGAVCLASFIFIVSVALFGPRPMRDEREYEPDLGLN